MEEFYDGDDDSSYDDEYVDPDGLADELEEEEDWEEEEDEEEDLSCDECGVDDWVYECSSCDTLLCENCVEEKDGKKICPVCGATVEG